MTGETGDQLALATAAEGEGSDPAPPAAAEPAGPEPTAEQRAAISSRDSDAFCEAGAGTGKTRVLVERYCEAVERDGVGPERILAFTFTERAAAELRTRIRRELSARAGAAGRRGDAAAAQALGRAARRTEAAWVTTIHGFCRRLLAAHPAAAGIDPRFRVLDEAEASRLRRRAREDAVAGLLRDGDPAHAEVLAAYRPQRFGELAVAAHERLRGQGVAAPTLPPAGEPVRSVRDPEKEPAELTPAERRDALRAREALAALLAGFHDRYEELKAARSGLDFADLELRALELLRSSPAIAEAWRARFDHLMVDEFQDTNRIQLELVERLRGSGARVFRVGDELQSIYRFRNADLEVFRSERERAAGDGETRVQPLTGNFRSGPGVVGAVNALGAALLGDRYRPLVARCEAGAGPDPAAELLLTLDERDGWAEHERELDPPAAESRPGRVAEARGLARRLRELVDAGEARPGEIVVLLRAFTHVDAYEEALARAGLDPYVAGGRGYWSQQQVEDVLRVLEAVANPLDDEMLLGALASPAGGVSPDALWLLRRATRPDRGAAGETGDGGAEEADEAAGDPPPPAPPQHLWPLVAWRFGTADRRPEPLEESWLERIAPADAEALERFCSRLEPVRRAASLLPLDSLVERVLIAFDYDLALLARERGGARMANVRKLIRLAREFESHEGRDLRGFLAAAAELTERDEREGLAATQAEDHDGVRIMTVHAAKGLEFPVVAVADLGRSLSAGERAGDVAIGRLESDPGASPEARFGLRLVPVASRSVAVWELRELEASDVAEAAEEGCRLVHVAATRACDRLIMSGAFKASDREPCEPGPRDSPIRRLLPALAERGWDPDAAEDEIELADPAPEQGPAPPRLAIRVSAPSAERARALAERLAPATAEPAPEPAAGTPPLARPERAAPAGHLSYSALADHERCGYRFYVERLLGLGSPAGAPPSEGGDGLAAGGDGGRGAVDVRDRRLALGNGVHAALEWSARRSWARPPRELIAALVAEQGEAEAGVIDRAEELVAGWLGSPLRAELTGAALRAELPFALELAGTIVRGQIDLLALGPEPTVVDYKTDALGEAPPTELGDRYGSQRDVYALAAAAAAGDGGSPATVRVIHCFLEAPDEPIVARLDPGGLAVARERLERRIEAIRRGRFEPTPEPSWAVCNGCPAAARLCPHPGWRPPRAAAPGGGEPMTPTAPAPG